MVDKHIQNCLLGRFLLLHLSEMIWFLRTENASAESDLNFYSKYNRKNILLITFFAFIMSDIKSLCPWLNSDILVKKLPATTEMETAFVRSRTRKAVVVRIAQGSSHFFLTLQRTLDLCIFVFPEKELCGLQFSNSCACEQYINIFPQRSTYFPQQNRQTNHRNMNV
jgi:hypothetical protein